MAAMCSCSSSSALPPPLPPIQQPFAQAAQRQTPAAANAAPGVAKPPTPAEPNRGNHVNLSA
jgi:hypothetical protein